MSNNTNSLVADVTSIEKVIEEFDLRPVPGCKICSGQGYLNCPNNDCGNAETGGCVDCRGIGYVLCKCTAFTS